MSDLFHKDVGLEFTQRVFDVMNRCPQHTFQILTKRPEIAASLATGLAWTSNIWMGVSVEDQKVVHRIEELRQIPAHVRFLSVEPLIGPIPRLSLDGVDWVIAGGESGPGSREMKTEWVRDIRDQCINANVLFFFKQWGGVNKKKSGRILDGRTWDEMPEFRGTTKGDRNVGLTSNNLEG
jgi:protein gp37